ncbi:hypothetical protein [Tetragenococcus halophilus]|uniref:hypothetical protein n=1 Tax=Tetragenococcus halophilus TaxID=51669 RepID=UPI001595F6A5|nr:hypothetical protein [Tetragenococcus halophilus]
MGNVVAVPKVLAEDGKKYLKNNGMEIVELDDMSAEAKGIDVKEIVKTFQKEYDPTFTFKGTPQALYKKIKIQLNKKSF